MRNVTIALAVLALLVVSTTAQGGLDAIERMDLSLVAQRVMKEQNWSQQKVDSLVREYRRFWVMRFKHPGQWLVPSPDVDEIWHAHILHTREYTRDCEAVFGPGGYMHHSPSYGEEQTIEDRQAYRRLMSTYMKDFGERPPVQVWGGNGAACGGCGASCKAPPPNTTDDAPCTMAMYFGATKNVCLWLSSWHVTNTAQYAGAVVGILATCALREWMTVYRQKRHQQKRGKYQALIDPNSVNGAAPSATPTALEVFIESSWYALNVVLAYLLMLLVMTYNIGICLTVILGLWIFNFLFTFLYSRAGADIKPPEADHCCDEGTGPTTQ